MPASRNEPSIDGFSAARVCGAVWPNAGEISKINKTVVGSADLNRIVLQGNEKTDMS